MLSDAAPAASPGQAEPGLSSLDAVQRDILEAAMHEFAQHGLAGARVDAIAARTSTSKRMIYYHFGSKEGLYAAVLSYAYGRMRSAGPPLALDDLPPREALRAYAGHVFDVHLANPDFVHLIMGENLLGGRFVRQDPQTAVPNQRGLQDTQRLLDRLRGAGLLRPGLRPIDVYTNLVALSFHFVSNRATFSAFFEQGQDPDEVARQRRQAVIDAVERQVLLAPDHPTNPTSEATPATP